MNAETPKDPKLNEDESVRRERVSEVIQSPESDQIKAIIAENLIEMEPAEVAGLLSEYPVELVTEVLIAFVDEIEPRELTTAACLLGQFPNERTKAKLLEVYHSYADEDDHKDILRRDLCQNFPDEDTEQLLLGLADHEDEWFRMQVAKLAPNFRTGRAKDALLRLTDDANDEVRAAAMVSLKGHVGEDVIQASLKVLRQMREDRGGVFPSVYLITLYEAGYEGEEFYDVILADLNGSIQGFQLGALTHLISYHGPKAAAMFVEYLKNPRTGRDVILGLLFFGRNPSLLPESLDLDDLEERAADLLNESEPDSPDAGAYRYVLEQIEKLRQRH